MTDVYLVTKGAYSDYHIVATFSTEAAAQRLADVLHGHVERFVLDPLLSYPTEPRYQVSLWQDGTHIECLPRAVLDDYSGLAYPSMTFTISRPWGQVGGMQMLEVYCYAESEAAAWRIAEETLAIVRADNLWKYAKDSTTHVVTEQEIERRRREELQHLLGQL